MITENDIKYVKPPNSTYLVGKRLIDIIASFLGLLLLIVPFLVVSVFIYIDDPGPIIFRQNRIGLNNRPFPILKFRTMKMSTPKYLATYEVEKPEDYITRVGWLLRKTSIDELPQLLNVFLGSMSLVGPRPIIPNEFELHRLRTKYGVYNVKPGITGLAQINGRDTVGIVEKVYWDAKYVKDLSLALDIRILFNTFFKVLKGSGVAEGYKTK